MKIIEIEPKTEEWLRWRMGGIGASDISVILGSNPYKTKYQLWEEKCGFDKEKKENEAMSYGTRNEIKALNWVNNELKLELKDICIEDEQNSIFRASLDGFDISNNILVELKSPVSYKTIENVRINKKIHQYWLDQIQWQIMITKPNKAYMAIWDYQYDECILTEIVADKKKQELMKEKAIEFWRRVKYGNAPELGKDDYLEIEDDELQALIEEYILLNKKEKSMKEQKNRLKDQIIKFGNDNNFKCYGVKISKNYSNSKLDTKRMVEDGIDIEKYKVKLDTKKMVEDGIDIEKYKVKTESKGYRIFLPRE